LRIEDAGVAFLLYPEGVLELSETAAAILELVDGARTEDDIATSLTNSYDAPAAQIQADVTEACDALRRRGFLQA